MSDKIWAKERWIDDYGHRHDPSTPKHNKGRKRIRRSAKRKDDRLAMKAVDDLEEPMAEDAAVADLDNHNFWLYEWSGEIDYDDADVEKCKLDKYKVSDRPEIVEALEKIASQMDTVSLSAEDRQLLEDNLWDLV
jgi:hypothetical protein